MVPITNKSKKKTKTRSATQYFNFQCSLNETEITMMCMKFLFNCIFFGPLLQKTDRQKRSRSRMPRSILLSPCLRSRGNLSSNVVEGNWVFACPVPQGFLRISLRCLSNQKTSQLSYGRLLPHLPRLVSSLCAFSFLSCLFSFRFFPFLRTP